MPLREFYGPLASSISATQTAYTVMVKSISPDGTAGGLQELINTQPECRAAIDFRDWVTEVLMPLNVQALSVIITRADLLDSP
jgi:hypothetical protein